MNQSILLSISGKDRAGIVRDVSEVLLHAEANIVDSSMTVLRGRFTMMLIVSLEDGGDLTSLKASLAAMEQHTGLTVQSQTLADKEAQYIPAEPDCVITVSGADKPGIVYAVTNSLVGLDISVDDVSTRSRGDVYMMVLEVVAGDKINDLKECLINVSEQLSVSIEVHHLDDDVM
ncbi:MAG: ACT domain-containing protein [Ghiorsea sp.]|nr:ACT domain-containing protein [Ghiorsea sp.]